MKRYGFLIVFLLLILAACGPAETEPPESESDVAPVATEVVEEEVIPTPTVTNQPEAEPKGETSDDDEPEPTVEADVEVVFPATNFGEAALIRDTDYFKGAEEPVVEIIEYGDFQ